MRYPNRRDAGVAAVAWLLMIAPSSMRGAPESTPASGPALFLESCSSCHSVGGGEMVGPDLAATSGWPEDKLRAAVSRMQENTGPLTPGQIDSLVALLKSPEAKSSLASAASGPPVAVPAPVVRGSSSNGRRLFFGDASLSNGGSPCFACHAAGGRGGNLAADLTTAHSRRGQAAVVAFMEKPPFPLMNAAYANAPVTAGEAIDLAAFLEESSAAGTPAPSKLPAAVPGIAGGFTALVLAGVALILRLRRAGIRSRLIRDSVRRSGA